MNRICEKWITGRRAGLLPLALVVLVYAFHVTSIKAPINWALGKFGCTPPGNCLTIQSAHKSAHDATDKRDAHEIFLLKSKLVSEKFSAWATWSLFKTIFVLICVASIATSTFFLMQLRAYYQLGLTIAIPTAIGWYLFKHPTAHIPIVTVLFPYTIQTDLPAIQTWTNALSSIGFATTAVLIFTVCFLLSTPTPKEINESPSTLKQRLGQVHIIMYLSVALLITSLIVLRSIYQWMAIYAKESHEIVATFISGSILNTSGLYTLILASLYLPALTIFRLRLNLYDSKADSDGIPTSPHALSMLLFRILLIFAPILTGPIGDFVGKLPH